MRFGVLGPLRVVADGAQEPLLVSAGRLRVLLAVLLWRANEPVSVDELTELVWDGVPPVGSPTALRALVLRLRRALGPQAGARVLTRSPGYVIELSDDEVDATRFEALCRDAESSIRAESWASALAAANSALELWRGAPLADVPCEPLRDAWLPRLEQCRLQILESRVEADLRLGNLDRVMAELRELTVRHPLRERFHARLMLVLAGTGRQAEALEAYQDARRVLVEQLGVEPGPELRELHARILAGEDIQPAAQFAGTRPSAPAPVAVVPRQLPAAAGHFTGRRGEMERLAGLVDRPDPADGAERTVVISAIDGMGGIGKTALAIHAARRLAARFPDGQLFIDLHGYAKNYPPREPGEALEWLLRAFGVPARGIPEDTEARAALYRQRLADSRTLIVLDNARDEAQVRPLLPGAPGCLVLITSRRRLKGLDDAHSLSLDLLALPDAIALLRAVAGADRIPADDPLLGEVAELCGRLPLALRIAGALLRHRPAWSLRHLAGLLRDQDRRVLTLTDGERDLATVIDLSYTGLGDRQQQLLLRLSLLPGPDADAYAAAALLDIDPDAAAGLLEDLVDHNLLIADAPDRYRLHDLIRAHSHTLAEQVPANDHDCAVDRLLRYYAHTAQSASVRIARYPRPAPDGPAPAHAPAISDPESARTWLLAERENLGTTIHFARTHAMDEHVLALAAGLAEILFAEGPLTHALELHQIAADTAVRQGRPAAQATALTDLGRVRRLTADVPGATDALTRALKIYREIGNRDGEATALTHLGCVRLLTGNMPGARAALTQALDLYRAIGNHNGEAAVLSELGSLRHITGDLPGAGDALTRAVEIYREIGNRDGEAYALSELGGVQRLSGDLSGAGDALTRAVEIYRAIGHRSGEAYALTDLGSVRRLTGDLSGSAEALTRALDVFRATGHRSNEAWALNHYAATIAAGGDLSLALALYRQALAMNRELNKPDDEAIALEGLGRCHLTIGETQTGLTHLHDALKIYERLGMVSDAERVRTGLAALATL